MNQFRYIDRSVNLRKLLVIDLESSEESVSWNMRFDSGSKESIVDSSESGTTVKSSSMIVKRAATPLRTSEKQLSDPLRKLDSLGESP